MIAYQITSKAFNQLVARSWEDDAFYGEGFGCPNLRDEVSPDESFVVVERIADKAGNYDIRMVGSFEKLADAQDEVEFRSDYCFNYGRCNGLTSECEVWEIVPEHYLVMAEGAAFRCEYLPTELWVCTMFEYEDDFVSCHVFTDEDEFSKFERKLDDLPCMSPMSHDRRTKVSYFDQRTRNADKHEVLVHQVLVMYF